MRRRVWKIFDKKRCLESFSDIDWTELYLQTDVNLANSILEDKIRGVIEKEAPMKTLQIQSKIW